MRQLIKIFKKLKHSTDNCGGWVCGKPADECRCYK